MPKQQAKEPIDLDVILVCRKTKSARARPPGGRSWSAVVLAANAQIQRLRRVGRNLSRNDIRVIVTAQALRYASALGSPSAALAGLNERLDDIECLIDQLHTPSTHEVVATSSRAE